MHSVHRSPTAVVCCASNGTMVRGMEEIAAAPRLRAIVPKRSPDHNLYRKWNDLLVALVECRAYFL